ncbi:MAG: prepilin-type N-terminal cleavage/methylation domain-containing protein [Verrucomicrobia bacterium]|nr:prepilin-type N-terminal cleavage/methylation domain-containing protein [Verrucomicrobiota bacterium]MBU1908971.1 prepilin-type N-terminal cleavage/methylation domain-containing protein [Verrucomicrobiota bacterium]
MKKQIIRSIKRCRPGTRLCRGFTLLEIMIVVTFIGLLAGLAIPGLLRARQASQRVRCIDNLRQIDSAKEQWAMENFAAEGDGVEEAQLLPYFQRGFPECPAGGAYTIMPIGEIPTCDQDGHVLEQ